MYTLTLRFVINEMDQNAELYRTLCSDMFGDPLDNGTCSQDLLEEVGNSTSSITLHRLFAVAIATKEKEVEQNAFVTLFVATCGDTPPVPGPPPLEEAKPSPQHQNTYKRGPYKNKLGLTAPNTYKRGQYKKKIKKISLKTEPKRVQPWPELDWQLLSKYASQMHTSQKEYCAFKRENKEALTGNWKRLSFLRRRFKQRAYYDRTE